MFASVLLLVVLIVVYIGVYWLNKKTKVPVGCEDLIDEAACLNCQIVSCRHHHIDQEEESSCN